MEVPRTTVSPIPVLMYHQIIAREMGSSRATPYEVSLANFESHLDFLAGHNFETISLADLKRLPAFATASKEKKYAIITFDDGYVDNYQQAFAALRRRNQTATFFVIVNKIGTPEFMTWDHLREMQQQGMSIQSHTMNHQPLASLTDSDIAAELRNSRLQLAQKLQQPVDFISFPHGSYDERVLRAVSAAGYSAWCSSDFGYVELSREVALIPRIIVRNNHSLEDFRNIVYGTGKRLKRLRAGAAIRRLIVKTIGLKNYQALYDWHYKKNRGKSGPE